MANNKSTIVWGSGIFKINSVNTLCEVNTASVEAVAFHSAVRACSHTSSTHTWLRIRCLGRGA